MKKKLIARILSLIVFFGLAAIQTFGQSTGKIAGKVTDSKTGETLIGLTVKLKVGGGVSTDVEGRYALSNLSPGKYTVDFSYIGYQTKSISDIEVTAGKTTTLDIAMEEASGQQLREVVVTATARQETIGTLYAQQKNSISISSGISSDVIRRSPDRNTGDVLKRVSGASIQDNKFVVVRGLSDRYNAATLNNAALPSTEPDRKAFSFDIIPSNLIDRLVVSKTASPDLPGDFSGGVIQIFTRDVPDQNFLSFSFSSSYNTNSTFNTFLSNKRNSYDYFGFDDGTRSLTSAFPSTAQKYRSAPLAQRVTATRSLPNSYGQISSTALPGQSYQLTFGNRKEFSNNGSLGTILSFSYRNSQNISNAERFDYETERVVYEYNDVSYKFNTSMGLLANLAYVNGKHKIAFKNIANRIFEDSYIDRHGYNTSNIQDIRLNSSELIQKTLINSQLEGNHQFGNKGVKVDWNLSYAFINREQPDLRTLFYARPQATAEPYAMVDDKTRRFFSDLYENNFGGSIAVTYPFTFLNEKSTFKFGVNKLVKERQFDARIFNYQLADGNSQSPLLYLPNDKIFTDENISANGFVLNDFTNPSDKYDAQSDLNAGFVMFDNKLGEKIRLVWGARAEYYYQWLNARDQSNQKVKSEETYFDVLPSLNFTYSLSEKSNLRFAASQTVARPEFRELAPFEFYDFTSASSNSGNPGLKRTRILNTDLRYEFYPAAGEALTASIFFKNFSNPIETVVNSASNADLRRFTYANAKSAHAYGFELEFRKSLSFINDAEWLRNITAFSNFSYIKSTVDLGILGGNPDRALQGQSPYLINAGLQYTSKGGLGFSAMYNKAGERIYSVGYQGYSDIYEKGRDVLDLQVSKRVFKNGEFKLNFSDIFNQRVLFYQNMDGNKIYNSNTDRIMNGMRQGSSISLQFNYNFNLNK
ncbi:MAG TPA: TonB-dependent receptor [Sphingobacteriaceae bacterium]